jgi:hypothetical protein
LNGIYIKVELNQATATLSSSGIVKYTSAADIVIIKAEPSSGLPCASIDQLCFSRMN